MQQLPLFVTAFSFPFFRLPFPHNREKFANTFFMRYPVLKKIFCSLSALLCIFSACNAVRPDSSGSDPESSQSDYVSESKDFSSPETPPDESETTSEEWDMSDVDISYIDGTRKLIAFTFDDAPSKTLENILAVFAAFDEEYPELKATATVFFNGIRFENSTPHLLQTACALGFELGNHTYAHYDLTTLSETELQSEIEKMDKLLKKADGKERHLLRAPFGKINDFICEHASAPLIDWTIETLDWTGISEERIYNTVFENRFNGAIVLMHDGYPNTVSALKRLLPDLAADGYQIVGVSAMAKAHGCTLRRGGVYIRARKQ